MRDTDRNFVGVYIRQFFQKVLALMFCLIFVSAYIYAEDVTVSGQVTDPNNEPLVGVSVKVVGANVGTTTGIDGRYQLTVSSSASLQFSYMGFQTQIEKIGSRKVINIVLEEDSRLIDEIVVVGYDTQRKANLTGAVESIDVAKQLEGRPLSDLGRGLQGAAPGLTVTTSSGRLGTTPKFRIRGAIGTMLNEGNDASNPLILVDGVEISDLNMINSDDVESISVLKDAASSSIYGTRAAFGVILISTKSGKEKSKFKVNYSNNFSWAAPTVVPKMAKSYEGAAMALESRQRRAPGTVTFTTTNNLVWNAESIERMKEWERVFGDIRLSDEMVLGRDFEIIDGSPYFYRSWQAADEYVKDFSFSQQHNFSVGGSSGITKYYLGLGYMGQSGVIKVKPDQYRRYNVNFNTDSEINKWLSIRSKLLYSRTNLETPFNFTQANYDALYYLYRWPTIMPYGTYQGKPFRNSVAETAAANINSDIKDYTRISLGTSINFTNDLSLDLDYTYNMDNQMIIQRGGTVGGWDFWAGPLTLTDNWAPTNRNKIDHYFYKRDYHVGNAVLRYKKVLDDHNVNAFVGSNLEYKEIRYLNAEKRELLDMQKPEVSLAVGDQFIYGSHYDWAIAGFFARINYAYRNRYLIELNGRYDGSSRFPLNKQWGFFPSASVGYVLSEEDWMESLKPYLSFAKLRLSYGSIGNQDIGANRFRAVLSSYLSGWIVNEINETSFGLPLAIRDGFTWETINTVDGGLDMRFFRDKFGVSFDYFRRVNDGMVVGGTEVPSFFGTDAPYENAAQLTTKGWELSLDYRHTFANQFRLNLAANLADARTVITKHPRTANSILDGSNYEGKIYGEIWGFETDRFFTAEDFNEDGTPVEGIASQKYFEDATGLGYKYGPGDIKYKDLDNDGEITWGNKTANDHGDWKRIGNSTPRYEYNFRVNLEYKGVDLGVFLQGVGSRQHWATGGMLIPGWFNTEGTYYAHQTDYWTPENPNAFYPRLADMNQPGRYSAAGFNFLTQTKYLLDMSYCRLKNVTVGYSLPAATLNKIKLDRFRLYFSFENLFEFDRLGNLPIDPETDISYGDGGSMGFGRIYPFTRSMSCGLQISL
ncbi:MAG: TonB-dependent receptor [Bacteroidales bacterium]|nr:TonB-dependent receptor [Bacteroidales bacterium]